MERIFILRHLNKHVMEIDIMNQTMGKYTCIIVVLILLLILMQVELLFIQIIVIVVGGVREIINTIQLTILMQISNSFHH